MGNTMNWMQKNCLILVAGAAMIGTSAVAADNDDARQLRAEQQADRVRVFVGEDLFTEYLFLADAKYPYFYPVNGPASGRSITVRQTEPYPHHSSLFFGCDRVNDGNFWQEGLDRGRIISTEVDLVAPEGREIVIEQVCRWERPGAPSPFRDVRRITVRAPSRARREIDFDITLQALGPVRILKTNHSLFSARLAPDLAVSGGGQLKNAEGDTGETETFGKRSYWADYRGERDGATEGLAMLCHPANRWSPPPWFTRDYGFISPTPMFWLEGDQLDMAAGETLRLRYRVVVHSDRPAAVELQKIWQDWGAQ